MLRHQCTKAAILVLLLIGSSYALIISFGKGAVRDQNWPEGSLPLANLNSRVGGWEGPPFGGGENHFQYRGDTAAFQEALDLFGKIRAPSLRLVVRAGPNQSPFLDAADKRVDWDFVVWNPEHWYRLYNNPRTISLAEDQNLGKSLPPPTMDVYIGGGGLIDWGKVRVPAGIAVEDERADANGVAAGPAIRGDVFDMITSKPIASARIKFDKLDASDGKQKWVEVVSGKSDLDGHFEPIGFPTGVLRVCVLADGYAPRQLDYAEFLGNTLKRYSVQLSPAAIVSGSVIDTDDKPVGSAKVNALSFVGPDGRSYRMPEESIGTTADEQGRFILSGLPRGYAQVSASHSSLHQLNPLQIQTVPSDNLVLQMIATEVLRVKVVDASGNPVASGHVFIRAQGEQVGKWGGSFAIKPDGTVETDRIPPGNYQVSADQQLAMGRPDPNAKPFEIKSHQTVEIQIVKP